MSPAMRQRVWKIYYNERRLIWLTNSRSRGEAHIRGVLLNGDESQDAVEKLSPRGKKYFDLLVKYLG